MHAKPKTAARRPNAVAMRSVRFRVPDTRDPAFRAEAQRQAGLLAASSGEADDQAFIDSVSILVEE